MKELFWLSQILKLELLLFDSGVHYHSNLLGAPYMLLASNFKGFLALGINGLFNNDDTIDFQGVMDLLE